MGRRRERKSCFIGSSPSWDPLCEDTLWLTILAFQLLCWRYCVQQPQHRGYSGPQSVSKIKANTLHALLTYIKNARLKYSKYHLDTYTKPAVPHLLNLGFVREYQHQNYAAASDRGVLNEQRCMSNCKMK